MSDLFETAHFYGGEGDDELHCTSPDEYEELLRGDGWTDDDLQGHLVGAFVPRSPGRITYEGMAEAAAEAAEEAFAEFYNPDEGLRQRLVYQQAFLAVILENPPMVWTCDQVGVRRWVDGRLEPLTDAVQGGAS